MEGQLITLLEATHATDHHVRSSAEAQLRELYPNEEFILALASLASQPTMSAPVRLSALVVLRTFVNVGWSPNLDEFEGRVLLSDSNKATVRQALFNLATSGADTEDRSVRAMASYAVSKIASVDFPEDWPDLLPALLQIVPTSSDTQLHGALKVLADLVDVGFNEDQFLGVAANLVSTVFAIATNSSRKPILRALAVSVFCSCFSIFEMMLDNHKKDVKQFLDQAMGGWAPFFLSVVREPLPQAPSEEDELQATPSYQNWRGVVALKIQVAKTSLRIRELLPELLTPISLDLFKAIWSELFASQSSYAAFYIDDERQARLEDADDLPCSLDFLVLEDMDLLQNLLKAPPVRNELRGQLNALGANQDAIASSSWLSDLIKLAISYAQITLEDEGMWDIDVNLFLSEETSVTANYTSRSCASDLIMVLNDWLKTPFMDCFLACVRAIISNSSSSWKLNEAALYILNQLFRDLEDSTTTVTDSTLRISEEIARVFISQDQAFLRSRGYLTAGSLAKISPEQYHVGIKSLLETTVKAISIDNSQIVQVSCLRSLQDFLESLPSSLTKSLQLDIVTVISNYLSTLDAQDVLDSDDLLSVIVESLAATIDIDATVCLSSPALDVLFNIVKLSPENPQISSIVTDTYENIVIQIEDKGVDAYTRLCEKSIPPLITAADGLQGNAAEAMIAVATELMNALIENGCTPLPAGLAASIIPVVSQTLLKSSNEAILVPSTMVMRATLAKDAPQFFGWTDPESNKSALEIALLVIDRLLGESVSDDAAVEVGGLAAEVVEKAGPEKLGPYFPQLLGALARRLTTAEASQFIQSLVSVFARLSISNAADVVNFLSTLDINGTSGLYVVLTKWLENSVNFAGFDEIQQNIVALTKLYQLNDPRVNIVHVKGDLIVQDTGRIKTRSQARSNPDQYTMVPIPLKIIKLLVAELDITPTSANPNVSGATAAGTSAAIQDFDSDDEKDEWEDEGSATGGDSIYSATGLSKQQIASLLEDDMAGDSSRMLDPEALQHLRQFFVDIAPSPAFQEIFSHLTSDEQEKLRAFGSSS